MIKELGGLFCSWIRVCGNCGITVGELESVSKDMGMSYNEITGCYESDVHQKKCSSNWIDIRETVHT